MTYTYDIFNLHTWQYVTSVTVQKRGGQFVCNALVKMGINPLDCVWVYLGNE